MNINITAPPDLTGNGAEDAARLNEWCRALYLKLRQLLYTLDGENITGLDPGKLTKGTLNTNEIALSGALTHLSGTDFSLFTPDGNQYIKCSDGKIYISAESVITNEKEG